VWTVFVDARLREPVHFRADLSGTQPPLIARDEWFAPVLVDDVVPVKPDVLVEDVENEIADIKPKNARLWITYQGGKWVTALLVGSGIAVTAVTAIF